MSALEDSGESGLFAFNGQTGILSQLASGEYNVTSVNETKFLIRPAVGSTAPDSLFFLYLEGQEIKKSSPCGIYPNLLFSAPSD